MKKFRATVWAKEGETGFRPIGSIEEAQIFLEGWPAIERGPLYSVRKRRARRRAVGTRAPILVEARPNARWSLDFVHDQLACGRRFRVLNIVDDVTRECLTAIPDIAEWREDFNTARPHSSLGYQIPAAFAEAFTATGSPVAQPAPYGVTETAETLTAAG